ncbi:MAG: ABC transporter ATP-binding protein [Synergistaceae bacterium]|jgi:ABC-type nitrate/sulfonate/bicarbonate transport system ATPase subunit|nr:ABC transporter ATP-binding protein [Synergistaceae bacterium]
MSWFDAVDIRKEYPLGDGVKVALDGFSLSAPRGDFVSIIGRSGSGKTTFLRIVAGLLEKTSGEIRYGGGVPPRIGMVFQEPRLMPWLTVEKNVLFAHLSRNRKAIPYDMAKNLLEMLGLSLYKDAYPSQLSGGMAQRVALGRALCREPELILMDEPFGSLDYFTRRSLQEEILRLYMRDKKTIFLVTHDVDEAVALSRRVVVLDQGRVSREIDIDLEYPRKRTNPAFAATVEMILSYITG